MPRTIMLTVGRKARQHDDPLLDFAREDREEAARAASRLRPSTSQVPARCGNCGEYSGPQACGVTHVWHRCIHCGAPWEPRAARPLSAMNASD